MVSLYHFNFVLLLNFTRTVLCCVNLQSCSWDAAVLSRPCNVCRPTLTLPMPRWTDDRWSATRYRRTTRRLASQAQQPPTSWTGYTCGRGAWRRRQLLPPDFSSSLRRLLPLAYNAAASSTLANYVYRGDRTVLSRFITGSSGDDCRRFTHASSTIRSAGGAGKSDARGRGLSIRRHRKPQSAASPIDLFCPVTRARRRRSGQMRERRGAEWDCYWRHAAGEMMIARLFARGAAV